MPPFGKVVAKHYGWLATFEPTGKERHEADLQKQNPPRSLGYQLHKKYVNYLEP